MRAAPFAGASVCRGGSRTGPWLPLPVCIILCALPGFGCASDSGLRECRSQGDCDDDQVCQAGYCIDLCQNHGDCAHPRVCEEGFCVLPDSCRTQSQCEYDEACVGGYCIPQMPECDDILDCPPGHVCDRGACVLRSDTDDAGDAYECGSEEDCLPHHQCLNHRCVLVSTDPEAEEPDRGDDLPPDGQRDTAVDMDHERDPRIDGMDAADECEGRANGQLGDSCQGPVDCCNGLCLGDPSTSQGICTEPCETYVDCNPSGLSHALFCYEIDTSNHFCATSDYIEICASPDTCTGGVCLHGDGTSGCSWFCEYTSECPPGSACGQIAFWDENSQSVVYINACAPVGTSCTVDSGSGLNTCLTGLCITDEDPLVGFCSTFCNTYDPAPCPSGLQCSSIDEEYPPVCVP